MKIIDAHCHFDHSIENASEAAKALNDQLLCENVDYAVVLHLESQRWSPEEFSKAIHNHQRLIGFVNVHPDIPDARDRLRYAVEKLGFKGLKLHPRLQKTAPNTKNTMQLVRFAGELGIPVIIDAFPDGDWLMAGYNILQYADLCKGAPETKIIVAHMGGHHVIDLLMLCKRLPNMYLDTSYSTLYFRGSGVELDLTYAMRSLKFNKILYGSDYPDRNIHDSIQGTLTVFEKAGMSSEAMAKIMYTNAAEVFEWLRL
jgi:predicted TIM-barrel fold metal-dependent hydrolase